MAYLEAELIELAKQNNINISREFNQYLKDRLLGIQLNNQKDTSELQKELAESIAKTESLRNELKLSEKQLEIDKKAKISKELEDILK